MTCRVKLSDSVANILAVKTYGREAYERSLFDAANKDVVVREFQAHVGIALRERHHHRLYHGGLIMSVVTVFIAGGNAWYGITPGTLVMMFTYTYTVTNQFNFINNGLKRFNRASAMRPA